mmetsp:Transcript_51420/g.171631  ORF Transcript_51420/g.171631 Transcript_51420/m.171631 type:complete len:240 (-) Transcript_51420:340-1059(-)
MAALRQRLAHNPFADINGVMRAHPLKTSIVVTTVKAGLADLLVQTVIEGRREVDERRVATFVVFGATYQGCFQYWMFNHWFEQLFPGRGLVATAKKVFAVNAVGDPVFFFPCFYTLKEVLSRDSLASALTLDTVRCALSSYYKNCLDDWRNTWATWIPGHAITYGVLPMHLRMPWVAAVSFGYLSLLSFTRGARITPTEPLEASTPATAMAAVPAPAAAAALPLQEGRPHRRGSTSSLL